MGKDKWREPKSTVDSFIRPSKRIPQAGISPSVDRFNNVTENAERSGGKPAVLTPPEE